MLAGQLQDEPYLKCNLNAQSERSAHFDLHQEYHHRTILTILSAPDLVTERRHAQYHEMASYNTQKLQQTK